MSDKNVVDVGKALHVKNKSGIKKGTIKAMHREMNTLCVDSVTGWSGTVLNPQMPQGHKLVILIQALGEVADAMRSETPKDLTTELVKLATLTAGWAESSKRGSQEWTT
jgi:hypothetical protein